MEREGTLDTEMDTDMGDLCVNNSDPTLSFLHVDGPGVGLALHMTVQE